ncbi:MAG: hypothetical protein FWF81_08280 [Defluviitaleaceae bacterium]|nr:hypothetical protein [Defluviitaleaceae bacterium]
MKKYLLSLILSLIFVASVPFLNLEVFACSSEECNSCLNASIESIDDLLAELIFNDYNIEVEWCLLENIQQVYIVAPDGTRTNIESGTFPEEVVYYSLRFAESLTAPPMSRQLPCCGAWVTGLRRTRTIEGIHLRLGFFFACPYSAFYAEQIGWFSCRPNSISVTGAERRIGEQHHNWECNRSWGTW